MSEPHPLRCETCSNRQVNANDDSFCTVIGDFIAGEIEMETTAKVGCASHNQHPVSTDEQSIRQDAINIALEKIENFACSCIWSDAPDCPGAVDGDVDCDGCERFEYSDPEDLRNYIKELRKGGKQEAPGK